MKEKSLIKECWAARKKWLSMENTKLNENSFDDRMNTCGYYKFLRKKLNKLIPEYQKYEGVPLGFKILLNSQNASVKRINKKVKL
jgi:hypothetical protein